MSRLHQANISWPDGAIAPDDWSERLGVRLPRDFVISRHRNGEVASRRGDLYWDWSGYDPRGRAVGLSFAFWIKRAGKSKLRDVPPARQAMVDEMQHLMSLMIFKRYGPTLAFETLNGYLSAFCSLACYCEKHSLTIPELMGDGLLLTAYVATLEEGGRVLTTFTGIVGILLSLEPGRDIGYPIAGNAVVTRLRRMYYRYRLADKQTSPIPTRIYLEIISSVAAQLKSFSCIADRFFSLTSEVLANIATRRMSERPPWSPESVTKHELDHYFEERGLKKSAKGISRGLTEIQLLCKLTIHIFSGMRHEEVLALPFFCTEIHQDHGRNHYLLCGQTTKLNHGKVKRTKWVTNREAYEAVLLAQRIATLIYNSIEEVPKQTDDLINRYPLFVSTGYLAIHGRLPASADAFYTQRLPINRMEATILATAVRPVIQECDLQELEQIDPHRAWNDEAEFQVGRPWPLATHQFRRSLAIYAQRSGIVSLPSLRRQLQHITKEMSLYYSKGSTFAVNFIESDPENYNIHIAKEWCEAKSMSEALTYLRDVLLTEDELFGGAGVFEQQKKSRGIIASREDTIRRFKRGEMAYTETPFGGCIKVGSCDVVGLRFLETRCLQGCKNLIGKLPKLERLIVRQSRFLSTLDSTTLEFRMEKSDLDVLVDVHAQWQAESARRLRGKRSK